MKFDIWSFEKKPLPEILSFIVDNRGKTVPTTHSGHILIATNCVRNESLYPSYEKIRYLSEERGSFRAINRAIFYMQAFSRTSVCIDL